MIVQVLLFIFCGHLSVNSTDLPESEYLALYDLYSSTNGEYWRWSEDPETGVPWTFTSDANPCIDNWQGVNCTIYPQTATYHISQLHLSDMGLLGFIPATIDDLGYLQSMNISLNKLEGALPPTITNLSELELLDLNSNKLTGALPASIGRLAELVYLDISSNNLNGSIPTSVGNLTKLEYMNLGSNQLSGPIPSAIGNLTSLVIFELSVNQLTGQIPRSISNLQALIHLMLSNNRFSGHIPDFLGSMTELQYMVLDGNRLTGHIPDNMEKLANLQVLDVDSNLLTGRIPGNIGCLTALVYLYLDINQLTGTVPESLGELIQLGILSLGSNQLTGSLPDSMQNLAQLVVLFLSHNQLTGHIQASFTRIELLLVLIVNTNLFSGPLPNEYASSLLYLDCAENLLTGHLPDILQSRTELSELLLGQNRLSGQLQNAFSPLQTQLVNVQLQGNQFTGTLPAVLFALPSVVSVTIVGSCLHGSLPNNICEATRLETLILYGLTTGSSCRATGLGALSQSQQTFGGAFAPCLLALPHLATLLMSSNGLTGSIPGDTIVSTRLLQLDLSHNQLVGPVPNAVQNHTWLQLDLSHNKLNGVLRSDLLGPGNMSLRNALAVVYSTAGAAAVPSDVLPTLSLLSNRLSGPVPNSVVSLPGNLSILAGNLFECKYDKSDLPQHDSDISKYECASNTFDISIYVWLGLCVCMVGAAVGLYLSGTAAHAESYLVPITVPDELNSRVVQLYQLLDVHRNLHTCAWYCGVFCLVVLLPYYAIISVSRGTHTHQYAYAVSAIYTSGVLPFVFDTALLAVLLCLFRYSIAVRSSKSDSTVAVTAQVKGAWLQRVYVFVLFTLSNITLVLGANVAFVYVVLYQSSQVQTLAQILLSIFKLVWSAGISPFMIRQLVKYIMPTSDEGPVESFFTLQLIVALFNNIAIPCLVVAAIDPNCFSNILLPPDTENVHFIIPQCTSVGVSCTAYYAVSSLQFTPPFTYSYQCSASFITSYAPTFIYMSLSTAFLSPLLQYALLQAYHQPVTSTVHQVAARLVPQILKRPAPGVPVAADYRHRPLLSAVGGLVTMLTQLGILLSFGAIFPPVALAMAVSIAAVVFVTGYKVRRFVHTVVDAQQMSYLDIVNAECAGVGSSEQMQTAAVIIICYCCWFYTLFLFDTLGDSVGFNKAYWVLIVVPLVPCVAFCAEAVYAKLRTNEPRPEAPKSDTLSVELSMTPDDRELTVNVLHSANVISKV